MKLERILLFVVTIGIQLTLCWAGKQYLNEYIEHYEGLTYSTETLHNKHVRAKRSLDSSVTLHFFAHGREFHLRLRRDITTFSHDAQLKESDGSLIDLDVSHIYEGQVIGDPDSYVHGSIIEGVFSGKIRTRRATYFVDKSELYFNEPQKFHSVIYSQDNIITDPFRHKRDTQRGTCGSTDSKIRKWMETVQNSATVEHVQKRDVDQRARWQERANIYTAAMNRDKRAATPPKLTCHMFLQSDPELWNYMTKSSPNGLGYTEARANEEITSLLSTHVSGIKSIYEGTMFDYKEKGMSYKPVSFVVHRMQVNNTDKVCTGANKPRFCEPHIDVSNFLNLHSLTDHSDFCLSFIFTYRDFTGGTLGLAWVGSPSGASGGICDKHKSYEESGSRVFKSLNTGIITLLNYGQRVPPRISTLTFAHEVGHNFGSPHDSGDECTPYSNTPRDPKGNYIMYASATSGDKDNNDEFSPCSIKNMTLVIDAVVNEKQGKRQCFRQTNDPFCGNKIVELGESCDCGYNDIDCGQQELKCCYPRDAADKNNRCKLRLHASCSATKGPCCNASTCSMILLSENVTCADENECSLRVSCNGSIALCPAAEPKPNKTACNQNTQICLNGVCSGSICKKIGLNGWEQCYITETEGEKVDRANMCFVACTNPTTKKCVSSADEEAIIRNVDNKEFKTLLEELNKENIKLQPGAPCDNYRGYCDVFQKCRGIDSDGPLARLKKLLLSPETLDKVKDWIIAHWWVVLLIAIGVVVFMGLFIQLCAVHTPSSNPNKPPPRKLSLRRTRHRSNPQGHMPQQGVSHGGGRANPPPYNRGYEMKQPYRRP